MMSTSTSLETIPSRVERLTSLLAERDRDISDIDLGVVAVHSIAHTQAEAVERFKSTRIYARSKGQDPGDFVQRNLIGTPAQIVEKISRFRDQGATHIMMVNHANNTFSELVEQVQMFGEEVLPQFQ